MPDSKQANDVAGYAAAVRAALSTLPDGEGDSLIEDLENHLADPDPANQLAGLRRNRAGALRPDGDRGARDRAHNTRFSGGAEALVSGITPGGVKGD